MLRTYIARLRDSLPGSELRLMTSSGGLVSAAAFRGRTASSLAPQAEPWGSPEPSRAAGIERAIGFDMGGTSTDVSCFDGRFAYEYETEKAGVRIVAPMLAIETVAAGGGSICRFDGVKLVVGPEMPAPIRDGLLWQGWSAHHHRLQPAAGSAHGRAISFSAQPRGRRCAVRGDGCVG